MVMKIHFRTSYSPDVYHCVCIGWMGDWLVP